MLQLQYLATWCEDPLIGKDPNAGKDRRQKEKGAAEDEMVRQHHWLNGHESEQTPGDTEGQMSLACCDPWHHRVGHDWVTEQRNKGADDFVNFKVNIIVSEEWVEI